jgi:hypothetical protein
MSGTPDFTFTLDKKISKNLRGDDDLLGLYKAAMTKYSLQNKSSSKDSKSVNLNALVLVLEYCCDAKNNVRMSDHLKKLQMASEKGKLEEAL